MNTEHVLGRLGRGAAAGFAGTLALQALRTVSQNAWPTTMPPIGKDPGEFLVEQMEVEHDRRVLEQERRLAA